MANGGQRFLRDQGPMLLFGILTTFGIVFIWTAKLWEMNLFTVTGVPIAIMVVYLVVSLVFNGMRVHNEQAGDNLYYMGFLFTLSSLGVSLYRFVGDASIDEIVRNFGVAVTSTICGIAFRILFNQMRRDPIDIERSVRHELAEMTRRVRSELDSSAREFSSYRRSSSQMLVEGFEEIAHQAEKTGAAVQNTIELLSKETLKPIQEASEKLAALTEKNLAMYEERSAKMNAVASETSERLNKTSKEISEAVQGLGKAVENLSAKFEKLQSPDEIFKLELKPVVDSIREVTKLQEEATKAHSTLVKEHSAHLSDALAPLKEFSKHVADLKSLTATPSSVESASDQVRENTLAEPSSIIHLRELPHPVADTGKEPLPELQKAADVSIEPPRYADVEEVPATSTETATEEPAKRSWFKRWQ